MKTLHATRKGNNMDDLMSIAQRIYDIDPWGARNEDATPETIAESIKDDPIPVIMYLLETIEELQA